MIDPNVLDSLARVAARAQDLMQAYTAGFEPALSQMAGAPAQFAASENALSVAAPAGSFFVTGDTGNHWLFTRDGGFMLVDDTLRTAGGRTALGFAANESSTAPKPLTIDPIDRALGQVSDVRIESDGSVAYTRTVVDPRTAQRRVERVVVGRLALARFPAGTLPSRVDPTHVAAPAGVAPHIGVPASDSFAALATYSRDGGRLDLDAGIARLGDAYLSFEAYRAAARARASTERVTMDLIK